jgi:hypothetical protein
VLTLGTSGRAHLGHLLLALLVPVRDRGGMHPICTGSFVDRFVPRDGVQRDPGFELSAVPFPLCRPLLSPHLLSNPTLTQHSILLTRPVFGVHYMGY